MRNLALLGGLVFLSSCDKLPFGVSEEESATRACEERLKLTLKSPSSYQRRWSNFTPAGPVTKAEYLEKLEADRQRAVREGSDVDAFMAAMSQQCIKNPRNKNCTGHPTFEQYSLLPTAFVLVEFDAANAFNTKLPGFFSCRINLADDGKYTDTHIFTSMVVPSQLGKQLKQAGELTN